MTMGDRIVVINKGLIQQVADPLTIYEHPANRFVASFIGSPQMNFLTGTIQQLNGQLFFHEGAFTVRIVDDMAPALAAYEGRETVFGIRPEDLYDKLFVTEAPADSTATATVEVVEPMGSEVYLHLKVGRHPVVARVGPQARPEINQDMDVVFDMGKAHFFDPQTEQAIV
jgi:multiple sugar transport system ATP-binding protein